MGTATSSYSSPRRFLLLIGGGSASGKSHLSQQLQAHFGQRLTALSMDNYYRREWAPLDAAGFRNFDHPDALDAAALLGDVEALLAGHAVERYEHPFDRTEQPCLLRLAPAPLLVVEGLFAFHYPRLRERADLRVLIEAPEALCRERRLQRDVAERGIPAATVAHQWAQHVLPAQRRYLMPWAASAELRMTAPEGLAEGFIQLQHRLEAFLQPAE